MLGVRCECGHTQHVAVRIEPAEQPTGGRETQVTDAVGSSELCEFGGVPTNDLFGRARRFVRRCRMPSRVRRRPWIGSGSGSYAGCHRPGAGDSNGWAGVGERFLTKGSGPLGGSR
jgi:hypothetical protein